MIDAELWLAVGAELARLRGLAGFGSTYTLRKSRRKTPAINTLNAIEEGRPGRVENIEKYCEALSITTADVIRTVLDAADGLGPTLTDAEWIVLQMYREIPDSPAKMAWVTVGEGLAAAAHSRAATSSG